jgi:hypothetical protein
VFVEIADDGRRLILTGVPDSDDELVWAALGEAVVAGAGATGVTVGVNDGGNTAGVSVTGVLA